MFWANRHVLVIERTESGQEVVTVTYETFLRHLREALNHHQDPEFLRQSPLATLFGVADRFDTFVTLQDILTQAIATLEPGPDEPLQSRAWRTYDSLYYRYIQQMNQAEVAEQLGLSQRQVRREQHAALEALGTMLWEEHGLSASGDQGAGPSTVAGNSGPDREAILAELDWLRNSSLAVSTSLREATGSLIELARSLADQHSVQLEANVPDGLPDLAVHPVALTQILLNTLGVAFHQAEGGHVDISARMVGWEIEIRMCGESISQAGQALSEDDEASLDLARQLADLSAGRLLVDESYDGFCAVLMIPACEQLPVLAIDDNADTLRLLERYAADTRYRVVGIQNPERALVLAQELSPQVIVLDVMMPQVDGWQVLRRLRQHPLTDHIPVIVCTIVGQKELALSLGASAFLKKPITRQGFLTALDSHAERTGSAPH
jgi:CheY-like chemotaxis protein